MATCNWWDPTSYTTCAGSVAQSVAGSAFQSIAQSFGQAADSTVNWLWASMNTAAAVHIGGKGFDLELSIVAAITGVVAVGLFLLQIIRSVLRREPGGMGRALKGLLMAFIGGGVAIAVVNLFLAATDDLCQGVVRVTVGTDMAGLGRLILGSNALTGAVNGSAGLLLLSLATIAAAVIVYVALVVRKVLLVVTAVFAPLAFAGSLADVTVSWTRRWIETTIALVVSKLVLVLIFVAGYGILVQGAGQAGTGTTQRVTQVFSGIMVLCLAGFAPWMALRVVHFTGDHAHQLHALGTSAVGGVTASGRMAQKAAPLATSAAAPAAAAAGVGAAGAGRPGTPGAGGSSPSGMGPGGPPGGGQGAPTGGPGPGAGGGSPPQPALSSAASETLVPGSGRRPSAPAWTPRPKPYPNAST